MKIKTTELTGKALDWAVGVAVGYDVDVFPTRLQTRLIGQLCSTHWSPTTNWGQLGPLLTRFRVDLDFSVLDSGVSANSTTQISDYHWHPSDPQIAACRAIVAAKLGDEVDVPEVLV